MTSTTNNHPKQTNIQPVLPKDIATSNPQPSSMTNLKLPHWFINKKIIMFRTSPTSNTTNLHHITKEDALYHINLNNIIPGHNHLTTKPKIDQTNTSKLNPLSSHSPILPTDKPVPSMASTVSFTHDQPRRAFGFRNVSNIISLLKETMQDTFHISNKDQEPIIDLVITCSIQRWHTSCGIRSPIGD